MFLLPVCHNVPFALRVSCIILETNLAENAIVSLVQLFYFPFTHSSEPYVNCCSSCYGESCWRSHAQSITSYQCNQDCLQTACRLPADRPQTICRPPPDHLQTVCRLPADRPQTTFRLPADHLQSTFRPPPDCLQTTFRPPADHLQTTTRPPSDHLQTVCRPPSDHLQTACRPPADHLQTTSKPSTNSLSSFPDSLCCVSRCCTSLISTLFSF
uniref:Uncharacterized protein n=1 Tax=Poecilia latipinna TaxID=48699 RepID=A0A3B3V4X4_9TELE